MPTIFFVPGAWIAHAFYQPFLQALTAAGYNVHYAGHPSSDQVNPSTADCKTDADEIAKELRQAVEGNGEDVLVMMHSYGVMPGAAAAVGLAKPERAQQGKMGGVIGLVFIGAFVVPEGLGCAGLQGGSLSPWIMFDKPSPQMNIPDDPAGIFAADVDMALIKDLENQIRPNSTLAFT